MPDERFTWYLTDMESGERNPFPEDMSDREATIRNEGLERMKINWRWVKQMIVATI